MDKPLEVISIKNEPTELTSSDQLKIPAEMQEEIVKKESDCFGQSEVYIKMEPQKDEADFMVIAGTSYEMCPKDIADEPMIKIEHDVLVNESVQDPLDVSIPNKLKDEGYVPIKVNHLEGKPRIKTDKDDSHSSGSNHEEQLLLKNNPNCRNKTYFCNECNKSFTQKCNLNNHLRIHTGEKPFTCDTCKTSFNRKGNLDTHMLIHNDEKTHVCDVCSKVFRHKSALNGHKLIHSGKKPFSCDECNKLFTHKTSFVVHKRMHTGDKPFACDICKKSFTHKSNLTQHKRSHTNEKPYTCDTCNKSFAHKGSLNYHTQAHNH